jgi:hypothetical protein
LIRAYNRWLPEKALPEAKGRAWLPFMIAFQNAPGLQKA